MLILRRGPSVDIKAVGNKIDDSCLLFPLSILLEIVARLGVPSLIR